MGLLGEYGQYKVASCLSQCLPRSMAYWVGLRIADRRYACDESGRKAVVSNLRQIYASRGVVPSEDALAGTARKTFQYFGKYLVDFFRFSNLSHRQLRRLVSVEHLEYLEDAAALGRGVLAVTAHFGNWEMAGAVIAGMGYPVSAVVLPQRLQKVEEMFAHRRERRGIRVIPLGNAAKGIIRALRARELVALLGDRDFTTKNDRTLFFGEPARIPRGPARLSLRTGAPIVPTFLSREVDDTFLFRCYPPIYPEEVTSEEAIQQRLVEILEKEIGENPHQWFIFDDFWADADRAQALRNTQHGDRK